MKTVEIRFIQEMFIIAMMTVILFFKETNKNYVERREDKRGKKCQVWVTIWRVV